MLYAGYNKWVLRLAFFFLFILWLLPQTADAATIIRPADNRGLVGYWTFNDGAGSKATDSTGRGNTGTLQGSMTDADWVVGKRGTALDFDGSNDYVSLPDALKLSSFPITVALWVYPETGSSAGRFYFVSSSFGQYSGYLVGWNSNNSIWTGIGSGGDACNGGFRRDQSTTSTFSRNQWHHIAVVFNSINDRRVYVDGVSQPLGSLSGSASSLGYDSGAIVQIGSVTNNGCGTGEYSKQKLDDIRIYNRALSAAEVAALHETTGLRFQTITNDGLVGYWKFDDGQGMTVTDSSGKGHAGTLTNMEADEWVTGKFGGALEFDGSNNEHVLTNALPLNTASYTLSAWIYPTSLSSRRAFFDLNAGSGSTLEVGPGDGTHVNALVVDTNNYWAVTDDNTIVPNEWNHIVIKRNGTGSAASTLQLYVNGQPLTPTSTSGSSFSSTDSTVARYIGMRSNGSQEFIGKLDEVRLYNRPLSDAEVAALYDNESHITANASTVGKYTDGLVGHWTFDAKDLAGTTAYDRSGQGNNGTMTNGPVPAIGKLGQALRFGDEAANIRVDVPHDSSLNMATEMSMGAWVNPYASQPTYSRIISKSVCCGNSYVLSVNGTAVSLELPTSGTSGNTSAGTLTLNTWSHIFITYDGSIVRVYVNGAQVGTQVASGDVGDTSESLRIGADDQTSEDFNGKIDDVRLYNRALSAREVEQLYELGR